MLESLSNITSQTIYASHLCGRKKLSKLDDRENFLILKRGIGYIMLKNLPIISHIKCNSVNVDSALLGITLFTAASCFCLAYNYTTISKK